MEKTSKSKYQLIDGNLNDWVPINRGVREGSVSSLGLFSLYAENIMRKLIQIEMEH